MGVCSENIEVFTAAAAAAAAATTTTRKQQQQQQQHLHMMTRRGVGDGSVGLERRTQDPMDPMTRVRTPSGAQEKLCEFFRGTNVVLTRCRCAQPHICIRTHEHDCVRTLKILHSMSGFGGLQKHEKTQPARVGLGVALLLRLL